MGRTFVIGDIHGAYRALLQCLEKAKFNYSLDHLICLGDVSDGWPDTKASVEELLQIKNLTYILGNHDWWTLQWMHHGVAEDAWRTQGGKATMTSYADGVPESHVHLLASAPYYYRTNGRLFVHAGIDPSKALEQQKRETFLWDRTLASLALELYSLGTEGKLTAFDEVYVGHTPIPFSRPLHAMGVWLMDTGAGWSGVLSMMNVETKETFISDPVPDLYPGVEGRKRKLS